MGGWCVLAVGFFGPESRTCARGRDILAASEHAPAESTIKGGRVAFAAA